MHPSHEGVCAYMLDAELPYAYYFLSLIVPAFSVIVCT